MKVVESVLKRTPVLLVVVFLLFVDFNNWNSFRVSLLYFGVLFWGTLPLVVVWSWLEEEEKEDVGPLQGAPDPLMYQPPSWVNRHVMTSSSFAIYKKYSFRTYLSCYGRKRDGEEDGEKDLDGYFHIGWMKSGGYPLNKRSVEAALLCQEL